MPRFLTAIGDCLHLHHAHPIPEVPVDDRSHPEDLTWLGLSPEPHVESPQAVLDQLALRTTDHPAYPANPGPRWDSVI